jgi:hypothetical protein
VEIVEVTPKALNNIVFDLKIAFEQENSPESERALYLDYITAMWGLFGQFGLLSPQKTFFRVSEKFGENPEDLAVDELEAEYMKEKFGLGMEAPGAGATPQMGGPGQMPQVNNFNQTMRGQRFGARGGMQNAGVSAQPRPIMGRAR